MRSALSGSGWLTGGAGLPAEVGVQARYKRLAVTHATTVSQIPTKSIGFIGKVPATPPGPLGLPGERVRPLPKFRARLHPGRRWWGWRGSRGTAAARTAAARPATRGAVPGPAPPQRPLQPPNGRRLARRPPAARAVPGPAARVP